MSAMQAKATVDHRQEVRRVLAVALVVNIVVSVLKLAVGVVSGQIATTPTGTTNMRPLAP